MLNILTALLVLPLSAKTPTFELEQELHCSGQALPRAGEAFVKELGIDKVVRRYQKRYVPKEIEPYIGTGLAIHQVITTGQIRWKWEF